MTNAVFYDKIRKIVNSFVFRILFAFAVPAVLVSGLIYIYFYRSPFYCPNYRYTHLYCPGCGGGRALYDITHLNLLTALDHNVIFTLFAPVLIYLVIKYYIRIVFHKDPLPFFPLTSFNSYLIIAVILLFFVLRNIPVFPFTILAP
ncbi:MAG: hypothetical protein BGN88_02600 [Clostridiales bacterium 43-6]|nr:MAG: hypothetical protein BGN88_02600 [Clostridiales bacterium 43-6]